MQFFEEIHHLSIALELLRQPEAEDKTFARGNIVIIIIVIVIITIITYYYYHHYPIPDHLKNKKTDTFSCDNSNFDL